MTDTEQAPPRRSGAFRSARTVFRVRGVPIRVDLSWLLIAGLVVWLFAGQLAEVLADRGTTVIVASAAVATLLFFASIVAHELGHALTSLDRDIPVIGITLFLLGGVTESQREAQSARDEFVIVGIGPFISLVLAALFGLAFAAVQGVQPYASVAGYLAWLNLTLAVFNVLPGYPLDGGRLLRSILWMATGSPYRSTRWAARVGQAFALLLLAGGLLSFAGPSTLRGIGGGLGAVLSVLAAGGWWGALIGFFLLRGASEAHQKARVRERLSGRRARHLMGSVPPALRPEATIAEVVDDLQARPSVWWPVGAPVVGGIRLADIDRVPEADWARTTVGHVAAGRDGITVEADAPLDEALDLLAAAPNKMLIVIDGGMPVGLLTPSLVAGVVG